MVVNVALCVRVCVLHVLLGHYVVAAPDQLSDEDTLRTKRQTDEENLIVRVEQGLLRGRRVQSAAGGSFISFQGIPYAKPPLGSLRFKDAEPSDSWEGVRDALSLDSTCLQPTLSLTDIIGEEDCLFLNVYTPRVPSRRRPPLPIMFWIHGGGYLSGSGNSDVYGPDYLVADDVIIVTINYRLGPLGFLFLNEDAPGNVGLKDQVAALRWVHKNIAAFGGDPRKITIFGESAGASSVHLQMLSPLSKGLFRTAIAQSGHAVRNWETANSEGLSTSMRLANATGCASNDTADVVQCLRDVNVTTLIAVTITMLTQTDQILPFAFRPVIDPQVPGVPRFLHASPLELIEKGCQHPVVFVNGFTDKESYYAFNFFNIYDDNVARRIDNWNITILPSLRLPTNETGNQEALQALRDFYMDGQPLTNETIPQFMDMLTDIYIAEGTYFSLRNMAKTHKAPLYEYSFIMDDALNFMKLITRVNVSGAVHADDIGYLFRMDLVPVVSTNSTAAIARARMVRMWTNLAKHGMPTPYPDSLLQSYWRRYDTKLKSFMQIGRSLRPGRDLNSARVEFWQDFYRRFA